jgi:hypothetical protein
VPFSLPDTVEPGGTNNITLPFPPNCRSYPYNSRQAVHLSPSLR